MQRRSGGAGNERPASAVYREWIEGFNYPALQQLWRRISDGDSPEEWPAGLAFEYLILRAFQLEGAEVIWPYTVDLDAQVIEQIDGVVYVGALACLIEAKDREEATNFEPIARLYGLLNRRPSGALGSIFSREGFTAPAKTLARFLAPRTILLWEQEDIAFALEHQRMSAGLLAKYRYAVQYGLPDYPLRLGDVP